MTPTTVILFAALGVIYLALWPIRMEISRRRGIRPKTAAALLPTLGGVLLLVFDFTGLKMFHQNWYLLAVFVHFFLSAFGMVFAIRFIRSIEGNGRDSVS